MLSARERPAVELYVSGFSAAETGREMGLSPKTVEGYLARAKAKLDLHTRRELVHFALAACRGFPGTAVGISPADYRVFPLLRACAHHQDGCAGAVSGDSEAGCPRGGGMA